MNEELTQEEIKVEKRRLKHQDKLMTNNMRLIFVHNVITRLSQDPPDNCTCVVKEKILSQFQQS